ncbi:MAG: ATP-binding protein [Proteobacteria bacterium]|nr:ATP-binding protein [Pseudomonadota bacterium]MDA1301933.1 ATP-binding protein [Pseudomonadota bacterium]
MAPLTNQLEQIQGLQRSSILRVYNIYRILLSFLFLFLFLDIFNVAFREFVGNVNPDLFRTTVICYIIVNALIGITTILVSAETLSKTAPSFIILIGDIVALTLLMSASGGVSSGLGNFIIFTLAFGGGLIAGRVSTVLPAIAFILTIYDEFYLFFLDQNDTQSFFQAGLLGIVYFVTNILFQTLSQQLRARQTEVFTLEQVNQLIIDRMRTGVVVIDGAEHPRMINNAAERLLQLSQGGDAHSPVEKLPVALLSRVEDWRSDPHESVANFSLYETGPEIIASFSELRTPSPQADTLIFLEDATEVQRQAQQLKLASLGRLSATIAHEIRNPLGAISHAAQLLGESTHLDSGDQRLAEIIQNHSIRMNDVIENVLQMSRRKSAEPRELKLEVWIPTFIDEFTAGQRDEVHIETVFIEAAITVYVDPLHLSQVLGNLCQNGLRYSKKKTGEARLRLTIGMDKVTEGPFLEVVDFGEGVDEEAVANLFEPFYTTETMGTGLGLYLSRELCEANDAHLSYSRAPSGGGNFRISFRESESQQGAILSNRE